MPVELVLIGGAEFFAFASFGGALYEFSVVDRAWPANPEIIQPAVSGLSRRRFWIPAHLAFELTVLASLLACWDMGSVRPWLLVALASHGSMRIWSAFDFIPKAVAFERATAGAVSEAEARAWCRRSKLRMPLDVVTCLAVFTALIAVVRSVGAGS